MQDMGRLRRPTNLTLDPDLLDELDRWISRQELKTTRSAVIEAAVRRFLAVESDERELKRRERKERE